MTRDEYWKLIDDAREGTSDAYVTAKRLKGLLLLLTPDEIYAFLEHQARLMEQSYTWELWGAAYVINGGCSDDGFDYFRGWLLAQGAQVFDRAVADPDSLADLVEDEVEAEAIISVGDQAFEELTGAYPDGPRLQLPPLGSGWDFDDEAEMRARYPRLTRKFFRG